MEQIADLRKETRHEPKDLLISFKNIKGETIQGTILDASEKGIAVELFNEACLSDLLAGSIVCDLNVGKDGKTINIKDGIIRRVWNDDTYFKKNYGLAIELINTVSSQNASGIILKGLMKTRRLNAQKEIAKYDLDYLNNYRRYLSECQIKLLELALITSVSIAAIYFGISYSGFILNNKEDASVSFWRTLVSALPGFISISCAILVSQKSMSIQRVEAFMNILKECLINNNFPREYRGWESESKKVRHIFMTDHCNKCLNIKKELCGTLSVEEALILKSKKLFNNPKLDFYNTLIYLILYTIGTLSGIAVTIELFRYQRSTLRYMIASSSITIIIIGVLAYVGYLLYQVRKGKFSSIVLKRIWIDIMTHCSKQS